MMISATKPLIWGLVSATCALALTATAPGCGRYKSRDDRIANVELTSRSGNWTKEDEEVLKRLKDIYELYADEDGISREGLNRVLEKYQTDIDKLLSGQEFIVRDLLNMFFNFDKPPVGNGNDKLDLDEIVNGLTEAIPTLKWIPDEGTADRDQMVRAVEMSYPSAAEEARTGLVDTLMRYDASFTGGNGDGALSRREIALAGIIIAFMDKTNFSKRLQLTDDVPEDKRMIYMQLDRSMNKQIFNRYVVTDYKELPETDAKLEWMQLAVRFHLVDRTIKHLGGPIDWNGMKFALSMVTGRPIPDGVGTWKWMRQAYDSRFLKGNQDGKFHTIEAFLLLTDAEYAQKVLDYFDNDLSIRNLASRGNGYFFYHLRTLYPTVSHNLFLMCRQDRRGRPVSGCDPASSDFREKQIRNGYWREMLPEFDSVERGGNGDGKYDLGELSMAFLHAALLDYMFALYDNSPADSKMTKAEAKVFLVEKIGLDDERILDAFYADIGLDEDGPDFWEKLRLIFAGGRAVDELLPFSFYRRMEKIIEKLWFQPPPTTN